MLQSPLPTAASPSFPSTVRAYSRPSPLAAGASPSDATTSTFGYAPTAPTRSLTQSCWVTADPAGALPPHASTTAATRSAIVTATGHGTALASNGSVAAATAAVDGTDGAPEVSLQRVAGAETATHPGAGPGAATVQHKAAENAAESLVVTPLVKHRGIKTRPATEGPGAQTATAAAVPVDAGLAASDGPAALPDKADGRVATPSRAALRTRDGGTLCVLTVGTVLRGVGAVTAEQVAPTCPTPCDLTTETVDDGVETDGPPTSQPGPAAALLPALAAGQETVPRSAALSRGATTVMAKIVPGVIVTLACGGLEDRGITPTGRLVEPVGVGTPVSRSDLDPACPSDIVRGSPDGSPVRPKDGAARWLASSSSAATVLGDRVSRAAGTGGLRPATETLEPGGADCGGTPARLTPVVETIETGARRAIPSSKAARGDWDVTAAARSQAASSSCIAMTFWGAVGGVAAGLREADSIASPVRPHRRAALAARAKVMRCGRVRTVGRRSFDNRVWHGWRTAPEVSSQADRLLSSGAAAAVPCPTVGGGPTTASGRLWGEPGLAATPTSTCW